MPAREPTRAPRGGRFAFLGRLPRSRRGRIVLLIVGALVAFGVLCAIDLLRIKRELDAGQEALAALDLHTVDQRGGIRNVANQAAGHLDRAAKLAHDSPWLAVLAPVPLVGDQVNGLRDLTHAAAKVGGLARGAANDIQSALDATHDPASRITLIDAVTAQLVRMQAQLPGIDPGAGGWLLPPLQGAKSQFVRRLAKAERQVDDGITLTRTLRGFLSGPRRYVVLGGNNAEMRGAGITGTAGLALVHDGTIDVNGFQSTFDLYLQDPLTAPVPDDLSRLYGWMNIGKEWRTVDTSPNFPAIGEIYASMSKLSPLGPVDGAIFVDVVTLQSLVQVIGPVTVDGVEYRADNIAEELLHGNYLRFPTLDDRFSRRDAQGSVATAVFAAMNERKFSLTKLAAVLSDAAKGRHLQAWSRDPAEQKLWEQLGADGGLDGHQLGVLVTNVSANKLDWFIDPSIDIRSEPQSGFDGFTRVHMKLTIANPTRAPSDTSPQIEGGSPPYVGPGDHRAYILFYLPTSAVDIRNSDPGFTTIGNDGAATVTGLFLTVGAGATKTINVDFSLPTADAIVELLPSSRLRPERYTINGVTVTDAVPIKVPLMRFTPR
jgi:hypothetical protein